MIICHHQKHTHKTTSDRYKNPLSLEIFSIHVLEYNMLMQAKSFPYRNHRMAARPKATCMLEQLEVILNKKGTIVRTRNSHVEPINVRRFK
jgi:hypothetical protein